MYTSPYLYRTNPYLYRPTHRGCRGGNRDKIRLKTICDIDNMWEKMLFEEEMANKLESRRILLEEQLTNQIDNILEEQLANEILNQEDRLVNEILNNEYRLANETANRRNYPGRGRRGGKIRREKREARSRRL